MNTSQDCRECMYFFFSYIEVQSIKNSHKLGSLNITLGLDDGTFQFVFVFTVGSKTVVDILNKMDHCISYPLICDIETGYVKVAEQKSAQGFSLPIQPKENEMVLTGFWADKFDIIVENAAGGGSVHTTHLVAF